MIINSQCKGADFIIREQEDLKESIKKNSKQSIKNLYQTLLKNLQIYLFSYVVFLYKNNFYNFLLDANFNQVQLAQYRFSIIVLTELIYKNFFNEVKQFRGRSQQLKQTKQYKAAYEQMKNRKLAFTSTEESLKKLFQHMLLIKQEGAKDYQTINNALQISLHIQINSTQLKVMSFQEVASNYMKEIIEKCRVGLKTKDMCCKAIYFKGEKIQTSQNQYQQFKRYTWPIKNPGIVLHISKTITGFMNSKGGIMYIGIMEEKDKSNIVVGITITSSEVSDIKKQFTEYVRSIQPRHQGFQLLNQAYKSNNHYIINDYVKLQFLPIARPQVLTNIHQRNEKNEVVKSMYVIKVIVKMGHPKHLYHIINAQKSIDFYKRPNRAVEKMQFPDAYTKIYENLDAFAETLNDIKLQIKKQVKQSSNPNLNKQQIKQKLQQIKNKVEKEKCLKLNRPLFHPNCQYSMEIKNLILKEDKLQSSSQSEDDD